MAETVKKSWYPIGRGIQACPPGGYHSYTFRIVKNKYPFKKNELKVSEK
jgi:hypothetical protein